MQYKKQILRIVDANYNRAKEGLRVCEDILRLLIEDRRITLRLKRIRHAVSDIVTDSRINAYHIQDYRNSTLDVGKDLKTKATKTKIFDIFSANAQRTKEAIRVLEEMLSLFDKNAARRFQRLRFQFYDVEKECLKKIRYLCDRRYSNRPHKESHASRTFSHAKQREHSRAARQKIALS